MLFEFTKIKYGQTLHREMFVFYFLLPRVSGELGSSVTELQQVNI